MKNRLACLVLGGLWPSPRCLLTISNAVFFLPLDWGWFLRLNPSKQLYQGVFHSYLLLVTGSRLSRRKPVLGQEGSQPNLACTVSTLAAYFRKPLWGFIWFFSGELSARSLARDLCLDGRATFAYPCFSTPGIYNLLVCLRQTLH